MKTLIGNENREEQNIIGYTEGSKSRTHKEWLGEQGPSYS